MLHGHVEGPSTICIFLHFYSSPTLSYVYGLYPLFLVIGSFGLVYAILGLFSR
jgi:hypothetical protein